MGLLSGLTGAVGGFAMGGPLGAIAGGLSGLFGDGDDPQRQVNTTQLRALTEGEQEMIRVIEGQAPGLMKSLAPEQQNQLIKEFQRLYYDEAKRGIEEGYSKERGSTKLDMARTGGGPSSIMTSKLGDLRKREQDSLSSALLGSKVAGEQVGMGRAQANQGALSALMQSMNSIRSNQAIGAGQTSTVLGGHTQAGLGALAAASTSPYSYINKNPNIFGVRVGNDNMGGTQHPDDMIGPVQ